MIFSAMGFVIGLGPGTASNSLFGKEVHGITKVLVTSPALVAFAMFAGTLGYWRSAGQALEVLCLAFEAFSIIADSANKRGASLGPAPGKEPNRL